MIQEKSASEKTAQEELRIRIAAEADPVRRASLMLELAESPPRLNPQEIRDLASEALTAVRQSSEPAQVIRALFLMAEGDFMSGHYEGTESAAGEGLALAVSAGDLHMEHRLANLLGLAARERGDRDRAQQLFEQSRTAARKLNDNHALAQAYANLGNLMRDHGELPRAIEYQMQALELVAGGDDTQLITLLHNNLGATYADMGDWEKSVEYYYRALVEYEKEQDKQGMATSYLNVAEIYLKRGKHERALQSAEQAVKCAVGAQSPPLRLAAMGLVGEASEMAGDPARARSIYDENIKQSKDLNLSNELVMNLRRKAKLLLASQEAPEAVELLNQALAIEKESGQAWTRARIQCVLGRACAMTGEIGQAQAAFESAIAILKELGKNYELAEVYFDFGRFLVDQGRKPEGLALVHEAANIFKRLEVINQSDAAERYLFQMNVERDRRLALLRSLSTLASHSLPLSEFAPRCLTTLQEALGFSSGTFFADEGRPVVLGAPAPEADLAACRRGELTVTSDALCLPLRLSGRSVGGIYLRWADPARAEQNAEQGMNLSFFEIVSNLLSVAMERNRAQPAALETPSDVEVLPTAPERYPGFIGNSPLILEIYNTIEQVAPTSACVLIRGDSGTGKELIARIIKQRSPRANEAFVALNCAAIPETLVESELFGIEKGVATGVTERKGKFEQAHRGTLFLDEIGDVSLVLQAKLLRVLQERTFERVGGRHPIEVDVRIIAATNKDLVKAIAEGKFREDLYYRLNVITINLPALRDRADDIPLLVRHFLKVYNEEFQRRVRGVSPEVMDILMHYTWPGNVRELVNVVERAVILSRGDLIQATDLPPGLRQQSRAPRVETPGEFPKRIRGASAPLDREAILAAMKECNWSATKAARQLGISRSHFYRLLKEFGLQGAKNGSDDNNP